MSDGEGTTLPRAGTRRGASSPSHPQAERYPVVCDWNDTDAVLPDACVHQLFELQAARDPDSVAVVFGRESLTYRELNRRANQVAAFLRKQGVGPETLVGVSLERRPELVVALLGVLKSGGAYVPLDPAYPEERLAFMVRDSGIRLLLSERDSRHLFPSASDRIVCLDSDWATIAREAIHDPEPLATASNLAYVMYTSGSTGQPKGAMILHGGLTNYLWWAARAYGVERGGSVPVHTSLSFDLTVTSLYPALLAGGQIELLPEDTGAQNLLAALRRGRRDLVKITPAHLDLLGQQLRPDEVAGLVRAFVVGGENLTAESLALWRDFAPGTRLINEYGPTETVVGCCIHEVSPDEPRHGSVPIGRPIANTRMYVLDARREPVPDGEMGEIYIGGAGVARGYLNRPELTAERFLPDPFSRRPSARMYKTGDLARRRPDGILEYLGRADDQVKVRGYRIELGEIEAALAGHPAVQSCAVLAREDAPGDKQLVGYVATRRGEAPTVEQVQRFLAQRLPEYMVPPRLVFLESLPLTHNGKVDRKALPAPREVAAPPAPAAAAARTPAEESLARIFAELLNREQVGVDDDFFELGGHSLLAIRALSRIRDAFGIDLPARTLFENPTVAGIAAAVTGTSAAGKRAPGIERRDDGGPSPLSYPQEQLWFLDQLVPGSPAYNIVDVISLDGPYDPEALRAAMKELVRRHESLRTVFCATEGRLSQAVLPGVELSVKELDLSNLSEGEREASWSGLVREEGRKTFDLARAPLFRVTVAHLSADAHQMLVVVHHIVADEWAMEILQREVKGLYAAYRRGARSPLPELPVQYADFAAWQRRTLGDDALGELTAYWRRELEGAVPVLALPTDRPRPPLQSFRGATEFFALPKGLLERLRSLAQREQATLFMVLEAAFVGVLHRHTGQDDILVGTPISNRTRSETEGVIGCFLNTVLLRTRFPEGQTFRALVGQMRERTLGALAHAGLPFDRLVAALAPDRDASRTPLFQVMFILHDRDGVSRVSKVSGHRALETGTSKFDLTLYMSETDGGLEGLLEYSTDLFEPGTMKRLGEHLGVLLEAAARDPDREVAHLPVLTEGERQLLLVERNDTRVTSPERTACLPHLFERQAARTPDRTAAVCGGASMTYSELDHRADQLARHLVTLGVGPEVIVGVYVERSLDMLVALLGILKAGGAYLPLDPAFPPQRLGHMVEDSGIRVLVTHRELHRALPSLPPCVVRLDADGEDRAGHGVPAPEQPSLRPDHLAYVLYTSGSTGKPKGVGIPHSAIVNFLLSMRREPGLTPADTLLAVTTLSFDIAGLELFLPLVTGAKVVIASRDDVMDPRRLLERVRESRCTVMQATPVTWRALVNAGLERSPSLRALCGGEGLPPDLAEALLSRCAEVWNLYGPTETTVWSTVQRVTSVEGIAPIGRPIDNTQVYVLDARGELLPSGVAGELYIGGEGVARGYLNRPELTREKFVESPFCPGARLYRTGDLARCRSDGALEWLGRTDHQVKLRGFRIELGEVEAVLAKHPSVREAVVVLREDAPGERRLVTYFVAADTRANLVDELRASLRSSLPEYMVPSRFVRLDALPLTPNGKVDRKALPVPDPAQPSKEGDRVPPRDALEAEIARIWQAVLGTPVTSVHDSFFDLGGHSLLAPRVYAQIERSTGIPLPLATLAQGSTVAHLAACVRARLPEAGEAASSGAASRTGDHSFLVPFRSGGPLPPIFVVHGGGGNVLNLHGLAQHLAPGRPFYGFQSRGVDGASPPPETIEEAASDYLSELLSVQPRGPYHLAGYCGGGLIAYEMAQRLLAAGERVAFLGLIDLYRPGLPHHSSGTRNLWRAIAKERLTTSLPRMVTRLGTHARELLNEVRLRLHLVRGDVIPYELREHRSIRSLIRAGGRYELRPYPGTLTLFRARDGNIGLNGEPILRTPGPDLGWSELAPGRVEVHDVPGNHATLLAAPNVVALAEQLDACLLRECANGGPDTGEAHRPLDQHLG